MNMSEQIKKKSKYPIRYYTSKEVAFMIALPYSSLRAFLVKYPELRPKVRAGGQLLKWTDLEIKELVNARYKWGKACYKGV
jgi:hypothetical protein